MARLVRLNEYEATVIAEALKSAPEHIAQMYGNGDLVKLRFKMGAIAAGTALRKRKAKAVAPTILPEIAVEAANVPVT
jgi:hypothetical protein